MHLVLEEDRRRITPYLTYSKKMVGRGLRQDVHLPMCVLLKGDRLEPSRELPDISKFEVVPLPLTATFWRMTKEDRVLHESPLLHLEGYTMDLHAVDALHTWHLGPLSQYVCLVFWFILGSHVLAPQLPFLATEETLRLGLLKLKGKLWEYYHFLIDFAAPMVGLLQNEFPGKQKYVVLPNWYDDGKFSLRSLDDPMRNMQPTADYIFRPLNVTFINWGSNQQYNSLQCITMKFHSKT